ncbi:aminotransferase class I/II-fold pyridoxal phosphate-dependent enzyme [Flavobacteriaceae bacterium R38]|nr:aminotransferase class I/II-fold pyridoxal phosphate-dependent enzyme [Flavobacteriaceae bacterium R38]
MSSPVMIPYKTMISINRKSKQPVYLQIANQFITLIKNNTLPPNTRLPGSRVLAELITVHRKTIIAAYDELILQGWIISIPKKGTFINGNIPLLQQEVLPGTVTKNRKDYAGFSFKKESLIQHSLPILQEGFIHFDDGVSDKRLTPTKEIAMIYRSISDKKHTQKHLTYGTTYGNFELRKVLTTYLNETRGLNITEDNIMITRGSQMGMHLASGLLIQQGDNMIVGETNYRSADITFEHAGANLVRVPVDEDGLNTNEIEKVCKKQPVKAVYVTSHHHHPTTVTLSAERRIHLLNLAKAYNFAILEDDYDYDFHYNHAPILPLSSHDENGNVIYIGSVCKTVAPAYRIGYLIASKDFIDQCAYLRRFVDRQGDSLLELTFARFIKNGDLDRHIKKVLKIYKIRRDLFCRLLQEELGTYFQFEIPKGGMAVWVTLNKAYSWNEVDKISKKHLLDIGDWQRYDIPGIGHNAIRIGFAAVNEDEIYELIRRLKLTMKEISQYKANC